MAVAIADFTPVFDPDEDEAGAFIFDEAHDWLEKKGDTQAHFPDIEESFRGDADLAKEYENYMQARDEED